MDFKSAAEAMAPKLTEHRHWLHIHPELPFKEEKTTEYLKQQLTELGIPYTDFPDYYGVIGHIKGGKADQSAEHVKTILLRADIDALPMDEISGVEYCSVNPGVMHSCGHDVHTTSLLGAAALLKAVEPELTGNVELLFQSAEEAFIGSHYYVDKGYLKDVDTTFSMHVWPSIPMGQVDISEGNRMASCDNFRIEITGVSCHGSAPHDGHDAIVAAAGLVMNVQTLVSRRNNPLNPMVISVDTVKAGTQFNIITNKAVLEGTMRTYDMAIRNQILAEFETFVKQNAETFGCTATFEITAKEDPVINKDPELTEKCRAAAAKVVGEENMVSTESGMGSEDFGYIMENCGGCFGFLGIKDEGYGAVWGLHSDKFRVNDAALPVGAAVFAQVAADYLAE